MLDFSSSQEAVPLISSHPKCLSVLAGSQTLCNAGDVLQGSAPWDVSVKHKLLPLEKELLILAASKPWTPLGCRRWEVGGGWPLKICKALRRDEVHMAECVILLN